MKPPCPPRPQEHIIIAEQCLRAGVKVVSLAPRFLGDFEKGVDYKGDLAAFPPLPGRPCGDSGTAGRQQCLQAVAAFGL